VSSGSKQSVTSSSTVLVVRSDVPPGLDYPQYREYLRPDFFFSCAYCTIGESEAAAIRFTIDHYEPRRYRPELTNSYDNLMYACNQCNVLKGDRMPSAELRARGLRFFRPDRDAYSDHFEKAGLRVLKKTDVGYYTIEALDLNRQALRRLRELRQRISNCHEFVLGGILALRKFPIDQLPPNVRGSAVRNINQATKVAGKMIEHIDKILKENARSPLIDNDEEARARSRERSNKLKQMEALVPGVLSSKPSGRTDEPKA
jgi:5-methylcytosine-specific restriction endonuclease McrA